MAFRGILPEAPSFGTKLARGLGGGFGKGLSAGTESLAKQLYKENKADQYKAAQQARLQADSIFKQYSTRIKEMQSVMNDNFTTKEERAAAKASINDLKQERDQMFGWLKETEEETKTAKKPKKIKFNPDNKEHRAKAEQLHKTHKDIEKVREILSKEFEF